MSKRSQKAEKKRCGLFITRMVGIATFLSLRGKKVIQGITFLLLNYNDHKLSGLRQTNLLFHSFCRSEVQAWLNLVLCSRPAEGISLHFSTVVSSRTMLSRSDYPTRLTVSPHSRGGVIQGVYASGVNLGNHLRILPDTHRHLNLLVLELYSSFLGSLSSS